MVFFMPVTTMIMFQMVHDSMPTQPLTRIIIGMVTRKLIVGMVQLLVSYQVVILSHLMLLWMLAQMLRDMNTVSFGLPFQVMSQHLF